MSKNKEIQPEKSETEKQEERKRTKMEKEREEMIERRKQMEERSNKLDKEREEMIEQRKQMEKECKQMIEQRKQMMEVRKQMEKERKQMIEVRKQMEKECKEKKEELKQIKLKSMIFDEDFEKLINHLKKAQEEKEKDEKQLEQLKENNEEKLKKLQMFKIKIKKNEKKLKQIAEMIISVNDIQDKNNQIREQDERIDKQDERIKEQNQQIDKQNLQIEKQNELIKEQNKQIKEQNKQIDKQNVQIGKQNQQIIEQNKFFQKLNITDHGKKNNLALFHSKTIQKGFDKLKTIVEQYLDSTQKQKNKQTFEEDDLINKFNETNLRVINTKFNEDSIPFVNREEEMEEIINGIISDFLEVEDQTLGKKITNLTWFGSSGIGKTRLAKSIFFQPKFKKKFKQTLMEYQNEENSENLNECYQNFLKYHLFFYINFQEHVLKNWETNNIERSLFYRILCALSKFQNDPNFIGDEDLDKLSDIFQSVDPIFNNFQQDFKKKKKIQEKQSFQREEHKKRRRKNRGKKDLKIPAIELLKKETETEIETKKEKKIEIENEKENEKEKEKENKAIIHKNNKKKWLMIIIIFDETNKTLQKNENYLGHLYQTILSQKKILIKKKIFLFPVFCGTQSKNSLEHICTISERYPKQITINLMTKENYVQILEKLIKKKFEILRTS
ncbi:transcription initiation factor tfiid subunit [Anaeramoeba flamelloides]|uniref:Transcription initiation factor tfiid subunit n=1 Tax=Anaeramoeba flamelloides TaxID=1746091 RepID=A0AAV7YQM2_9EUKA|nr:transcription initiation factor tfiid subunit [Anaeramoeba flamelloides]